MIASSLELFFSILKVSIKYDPLFMGSTLAIVSVLIFSSNILYKFYFEIDEPIFKKISSVNGFDKLFFIYLSKK